MLYVDKIGTVQGRHDPNHTFFSPCPLESYRPRRIGTNRSGEESGQLHTARRPWPFLSSPLCDHPANQTAFRCMLLLVCWLSRSGRHHRRKSRVHHAALLSLHALCPLPFSVGMSWLPTLSRGGSIIPSMRSPYWIEQLVIGFDHYYVAVQRPVSTSWRYAIVAYSILAAEHTDVQTEKGPRSEKKQEKCSVVGLRPASPDRKGKPIQGGLQHLSN